MAYRVTGADGSRTKQALGALQKQKLTAAQSKVCEQIGLWLMFEQVEGNNVVFVAEGTENDQPDAIWSFRGMITLSCTPNGWYINDLISLGGVGGVGGALADAAMTYIAAHPVDGVHRNKVYLLSLDAASDGFWSYKGFARIGGVQAGARPSGPVAMERRLDAAVAHPAAPSLAGSPPVSSSLSSSAAGSSSPKQDEKKGTS